MRKPSEKTQRHLCACFTVLAIANKFLGQIQIAYATDIRILDTRDSNDQSTKSILFGDMLKDIEEGYVDKVETETLFQTAAKAMTASLDPCTEFESKTESEDNMIRGRYGGVGMGIGKP